MAPLKFIVVIAVAGLSLSEYGVIAWSMRSPLQQRFHIVSRRGFVAQEASSDQLIDEQTGAEPYEEPDQLPNQVTEEIPDELQDKVVYQVLKKQTADPEQQPVYYLVYCEETVGFDDGTCNAPECSDECAWSIDIVNWQEHCVSSILCCCKPTILRITLELFQRLRASGIISVQGTSADDGHYIYMIEDEGTNMNFCQAQLYHKVL